MKKYIDADLLKSDLKDINESERLYYMGVFDVINSQPAADVTKTKHGKQIYDMGSYLCSECDYPMEHKVNYCPHCGVKMDR